MDKLNLYAIWAVVFLAIVFSIAYYGIAKGRCDLQKGTLVRGVIGLECVEVRG